MSAREEIMARIGEMHKLVNDGNLDDVPAYYTENAIVYMTGSNPIVGRAAVRESLDKVASKVKMIEDEKWEFFEQFNDNTAYGLIVMRHMDASGQLFGRYKGSTLWRKIDGKWFLDHYVFNDFPK